jgi:hypothetical protein
MYRRQLFSENDPSASFVYCWGKGKINSCVISELVLGRPRLNYPTVLSLQKLFPLWVRFTGVIGAILFAAASILILTGQHVNPLTKPLPFLAYPFYAATLVGWAWSLLRKHSLLLNQKV